MLKLLSRGWLVSLLFLSAPVAFMGYSVMGAGAQEKTQDPKPVKVSEAESLKYAVYRDTSTPGIVKMMRLRGSVTLEFTVNTAGNVVDITPISGDKDNKTIVRYASYAVSQWRYSPYLVNGKPTPMRTTTTIKYGQ
jgi:TonB family protein